MEFVRFGIGTKLGNAYETVVGVQMISIFHYYFELDFGIGVRRGIIFGSDIKSFQ